MELTEEQIKAFEKIWFIYGNNGKKSTPINHKLIQGFVEHREDRRYAYGEKIEDECLEVCGLILEGNHEKAIDIAKSQ